VKLHTHMSYSGYKGKARIVHTFSAGGVVFRRISSTEQATPEKPEAPTPVAVREQSSGQPTSVSVAAPTEVGADGSNMQGEASGEIEIVLVGRPRDNNWTLPKGTPGHGETQEETALREVCEETGLTVRILEEIGSIHYWFSRRGVRYKKEVFHYLMAPTGGDLSLHDHEYDEARWFPLDEATQRLAHENEIAIVRRAEELIQRREADGDAAVETAR